MTPLTLGLIAAAGISVFAAFFMILHKGGGGKAQNQTLGRLEQYIEKREQQGRPADERVDRSPVATIRRALAERDELAAGTAGYARFAEELERADINMSPTEFNFLRVVLGVGVALLITLRFGPILGVIVGLAIAYFGARFYVAFKHRRRIRKFDGQLADVTILLSNGLKAGYSFSQAMDSVANNVVAPAGPEFARTGKEIQLGTPMDQALTRLVLRNPSEDLDLMMTAVQVQRVVGGNLAEILDNIGHVIRERLRIKGEIRTLTAQARASGWIISLLPVAVAGILMLVSPDYFSPMLSDGLGWGMIFVSLISMLIGIYFIRRIVNIRI